MSNIMIPSFIGCMVIMVSYFYFILIRFARKTSYHCHDSSTNHTHNDFWYHVHWVYFCDIILVSYSSASHIALCYTNQIFGVAMSGGRV